jgi:hypothetical protein
VGPKRESSHIQLLLKLFLLCGVLWTTVPAGQGWVEALGFLLGLSYLAKTPFRPENGLLELTAGAFWAGLLIGHNQV